MYKRENIPTLYQHLAQYVLRNPFAMNLLKRFFSSHAFANSSLYKNYVMKKAHKLNHIYPYLPKRVSIETILSCNSKCVMCAHYDTDMHGIMDMQLYKKIIKECHYYNIDIIGLSGYGEPLLDKYFFERIQYLRKYNMNYTLVTNASLLDKEKAQRIFEFGGLKKIQISANAYDPRIYEKIMVGLTRDKTYLNILNFLELKEKYKKKKIYVTISTVKLHINKDDIKNFVKFWKDQKGVDQILISDVWNRVGNRDVNKVGTLNNLHKPTNRLHPCKKPWDSIYIYYDGRVGPCANDQDKKQIIIGDIKKQSLDEIFYGEKITKLRQFHLNDKRAPHHVCGKCTHNSVWI